MKHLFRTSAWLLGASLAVPAHLESANLPALKALSAPGLPVASANGDSGNPVFSGDSRYLFFQSNARDLLPGGNASPTLQYYRFELSSGRLLRVGDSLPTSGGPVDSLSLGVADDGEQITVSTRPFSDLPLSSLGGSPEEVHWLNLQTGQSRRLSVSTNGPTAPNRAAQHPSISANGQWVAFDSRATDLVPLTLIEATGFTPRSIYLHDTASGRTLLVNPATQAGAIAGEAFGASLSGDGTRMAFVSHALEKLGQPAYVHVRDNLTGALLWVGTQYPASNLVAAESLSPQLSRDGKWVSFRVAQSDDTFTLVIHDLQTGQDQVITSTQVRSLASSTDLANPQLAIERIDELGIWDPALGLPRWLRFQTGVDRTALSPSALVRLDQTFSQAAYVTTPGASNDPLLPSSPQVVLMNTATGASEVISRNAQGNPGTQSSVLDLAISPDGKWVAFTTSDTDLVNGDANGAFDTFLYEVATRRLSLVSRHHPDLTQPVIGSFLTGVPSLSEDNRILAFSASDGNRVAHDRDGRVDVFVQDLHAGTVRKLSGEIPPEPGIALSFHHPKVNRKGTAVSFLGMRYASSNASPLIPRLFVTDLISGGLSEVPNYSSTMVANSATYHRRPNYANNRFSFTPDGQWLLYTKDEHSSTEVEIGLFHLQDHTTRSLVILTNRGTYQPLMGASPQLSADGNKLWFLSADRRFNQHAQDYVLVEMDLTTGGTKSYVPQGYQPDLILSEQRSVLALFYQPYVESTSTTIFDLATGTTRDFSGYRTIYGLSRDGRYAVGEKWLNSNGTLRNLMRLNTSTGEEVDIKAPLLARAKVVGDPVISGDGSYVVFAAAQSGLTPNDASSLADIYVRDVAAGTTILVSSFRDGSRAGNRSSSSPVLSPDGRTVVFRSWATDLTAGQSIASPDFYLLTLPTTDTDGDGLPDDWEMAFFNTLSRDGSGDFDGDGHSDRAEYLAATNPTNGQSILRALLVAHPASHHIEIRWPSVVGKTYEVQARTTVNGSAWTTLGTLQATHTTEAWEDPASNGSPSRYYRILARD